LELHQEIQVLHDGIVLLGTPLFCRRLHSFRSWRRGLHRVRDPARARDGPTGRDSDCRGCRDRCRRCRRRGCGCSGRRRGWQSAGTGRVGLVGFGRSGRRGSRRRRNRCRRPLRRAWRGACNGRQHQQQAAERRPAFTAHSRP
jgi:hypothetical protein